jgi:hypothetical protein
MAFNIADFQSQIAETGVLQTNKFDVQIFPNGAFGGMNVVGGDGSVTSIGSTTDDAQYRCINATIPGLTMITNNINRFGIGVFEKMPVSANYTDVSLTFLMDRYGDQYNFWYTWFNYVFGINGEESSSNVFGTTSSTNTRSFYTAEYKDNYSATITITVYDNEGNPNLVATLLKAYPISVNEVPLSWTDNNNLIKLTTTITFREWVLGDGQNNASLAAAR